ncbi:MAG: guanylate kinase [Erysipelotrichaceae bacterium]|nr:guanylate kinase [Erysipelotrichaceae bacterium]MBQ4254333.1 guanylate kinase [Erysipelotrichaceae bacterium]
MSKGVVVILTGASSVGKGRIRDLLLQDEDMKLMFSISMTTRPPKEGEVDGKDYYFVSFKSFAEAIKNRELLEYTEFNGYYYGTPKNQIDFLVEHGKNVLIEVEAQGVGPLKLNIPEAIAVFVKPVSIEELIEQINSVYGDGSASAFNRINKAKMDLELEPLFNNVVTNDDPEAAVAKIKELVMAEIAKREIE